MFVIVQPVAAFSRIHVAASLPGNAYLASMRQLADKFKDRPYTYVWAPGGAHPQLEASLGVGGFGEWQSSRM